jgi:hypothetical protein
MDNTKKNLRYNTTSTKKLQSIDFINYKPNCIDKDFSDLMPYLKINVDNNNFVQNTLELEVLNNI